MNAMKRYDVHCRAQLDGDTLVGHGAVFGQVAQVPGGYEQIATGAFDGVLDRSDTDVTALVNHDEGQLLGRQSSGTLRVKVDDEGLAFEVDLPDTSYANDLRNLVARGDMTGASFGFIPGNDGTWTRTADGSQLHTIRSITYLRDVSPVTFPAYDGAGVALRNYDFARTDSRTQMIRARARVHLKEG